MSTAKPDFFIVGAPKCGTSAVSDWLAQHPGIFISDPREPNYFASDLLMKRHYKNWESYIEQFHDNDPLKGGEGTTWYLYSNNAPTEIYNANPNARIVILLRKPVEVVHSLYNYRLYYGDETHLDLMALLDREEAALRLWRQNKEPKDVMKIYMDVARYSPGVERYLECFGYKQTMIIFYEELQQCPAKVAQELFQFIGVDSTFKPTLMRRNESGVYRNERLRKLLLNPGPRVRATARLMPQSWRWRLGRLIRHANTKFGTKVPLDKGVERRIKAALRPDIKRLENVLDVDLSGWLD